MTLSRLEWWHARSVDYHAARAIGIQNGISQARIAQGRS